MLKKETRIVRRGRKPPKPSLNPRRKPLQARSEETRNAVLEAAAQILERDGLPGFNTNAVAERAGVSIGSLYQYFPGKEAILAALFVRYEVMMYEVSSGKMLSNRSKPLGVRIRELIDAIADAQMRSPNLNRILQAEERRLLRPDKIDIPENAQMSIATFLGEHSLRFKGASLQQVAQDFFTIARAMIDAAFDEGGADISRARRRRIVWALEGYLAAASKP